MSFQGIDEYVRWAVSSGVREVCFKELYVSTSRESVYYSRAANRMERGTSEICQYRLFTIGRMQPVSQ